MEALGLYALSYSFSAGRHARHSALTLVSPSIPSVLESTGLDRGDGKRPDNMIIFPSKVEWCIVSDAQVVMKLSRHCRNQAEKVNTNIQSFQSSEFAEKLGMFLGGVELEKGISASHWLRLGKNIQHIIKRSPEINFLCGSIEKGEIKKKEIVRSQKAGKKQELLATQVSIGSQGVKANEMTTERLCKHVQKQLYFAYKENGKQPLNFFKFVLDPDSFGNSVENIFHVSFLIKDGLCEILVNDDGLPEIIPKIPKREGTRQEEDILKNQVAMDISVSQWQELVQLMDIKSAAIKKFTP